MHSADLSLICSDCDVEAEVKYVFCCRRHRQCQCQFNDFHGVEGFSIVGISTITSTAARAYKLADSLRAKGKTVIMGGPHVTFMPDEALMHADYVVRGEGEEALVELLAALEGNGALEDIKGLSYKTATGNAHNPARDFIADLDRHPAPDFSLVHGWTSKSVIPIATSRGCPFACSFCSVIQMFGRKYRFKSVEPLNPALQSKWHWMMDLLSPFGLEKYAIGWLDFHVFSTFVGYAGFAISFGLSIIFLVKFWTESKGGRSFMDVFPDSNMIDELSYRAIAWGFPFLGVGIVSGAVWANYAWGTYWSWDPKETWSLITWFIYAAYLHARVTRGWRGKRAAYLSIAGFLAVLFLYWGVSFILPGLHAYA